jgi:hypothetical protein
MTNPKYAIAPVFPATVASTLAVPVYLGNGVRLDHVPEIYRKYAARMTEEVGTRHTDSSSNLALVSEYDAESMYEPDPTPPGRPRSKKAAAAEGIQIASLALWLARPTELSYNLIAHLAEDWRPEPFVFPTLVLVKSLQGELFTQADIAEVKRLNESLSQMPRGLTAFVASRYLWFATHEEAGDVSFGILSIAIEALVGPEKGVSIGVRISRRGAALLGGTRDEQCLTFVRLSEWWKARCELMHGDTLESHGDQSKARLISVAEEFVRQVIRKLVLDQTVAGKFTSFVTREAYLEQIASAFVEPSQGERTAAEANR